MTNRSPLFSAALISLTAATAITCSLFGLPPTANAQWPDRHGPTHNGHAAAADAKGLPTTWAADKNIAWKAELHDEGHSSPIVIDGHIWLTTASKDGKKQWVLAFNEETGEKVHDVLLFENLEPEGLGGAKGFNNYAAPSCRRGLRALRQLRHHPARQQDRRGGLGAPRPPLQPFPRSGFVAAAA